MLAKLKRQVAAAQPVSPRPSDQTSAPASLASEALAAKIMIVDDESTNVKLVKRLLQMEGYTRFVTTEDAVIALTLFREEKPDLLLLDLMMPNVSGLDILTVLRDDPHNALIPVLILTAVSDNETRLKALECGATDFLNKPVDPSELMPRVRNILTVKSYQDRLLRYNEDLEYEVGRRTAELEASRRDVVRCLARAAEFRDDDTGHHVLRVGRYARIIGADLGFDERMLELLEQAAQLHDIGKIGIPDAVLLKPGKLCEEEFAIIKQHTGFGKRILHRLSVADESQLKRHAEVGARILEVGSSQLIDLARSIALTHHEWWDGTGYPLGLKGEDIPLEGRIAAVADVFDALSTRRCYKDAFPLEQCFAIMNDQRGTHFDPAILDAFFSARQSIVQIQVQDADEG
jgi:putative two-component system response regulator